MLGRERADAQTEIVCTDCVHFSNFRTVHVLEMAVRVQQLEIWFKLYGFGLCSVAARRGAPMWGAGFFLFFPDYWIANNAMLN